MQSAIERWHEILEARARQMDEAYAQLGRTSADFWERRAHHYHRATKETVVHDPLFLKLRSIVTPQTSILDVGAGTGRFTLALAPYVHHITAVEPNAAMLRYLQQDAEEAHFINISTHPQTWQNAPDDIRADIVLCSHVLYPMRDINSFVLKLRTATRQACYIYMRALHFETSLSPLWQHFHGDIRHLPPGYIHALDVLYELGIYADVEVVKMQGSLRYLSLENATEEMLEQLILPDDAKTRAELRGMLDGWLVERNGVLVPPIDEQWCAIIKFTP